MVQLVRSAAVSSHFTTSKRPISSLYVRRLDCCSCAPTPTRRLQCRATVPSQPVPQEQTASDKEFEGIPPEEDVEVPGTYFDALNPNTKLGKAVRAAVDELNHLNTMEMETLQQCDSLLKKLGLKGSILQGPPQLKDGDQEEAEGK